MSDVRVRFAPSPTGGLHIGGVRTALFNYLFARKHGGQFILRIEDTDQNRFVEGAEQYILNALSWVGITPDESVTTGGPYTPYRQSERKEIYASYSKKLLEADAAYLAFDSSDEIEAMRNRLKEAGIANLHYNSSSRLTMTNSLTLSPEETEKRISEGQPYVVRLKVPAKEEIRFFDEIRGHIVVHSSTLDDKVLMKSDGLPTYHLANVVDDHLMKISHVIRGEEWLPSAPVHVLLYKSLGFADTMPKFAHLPLILKPDGNGKLSKRAADKGGFPIFPLSWTDPTSKVTIEGFRECGFLPEALINFLVMLGWNPGSDKEIFSLEELTSIFSLEKVGKSGTKFDYEKAKWFNEQYLNASDSELLGSFLIDELFTKKEIQIDAPTATLIAETLKTRVTFKHELLEESLIFFERPKAYDEKVVRKKYDDEAKMLMSTFADSLSEQHNTSEKIKQQYMETGTKLALSAGKYMQLLRVALTGQPGGPDLGLIMELLGHSEINKRIKIAIDSFELSNDGK
ncbi:MAG: glutamyl-tRNA synthetase [Cyclobacteriaceae bacterium]|jgi:glutamyl-tRNA synthetase